MPYHVVWELQIQQVQPELLTRLITCPDVMQVEKIDEQHLQVMLVEGRAHAEIEGWEDLISEPSGYDVWQIEGGYRMRIADEQMRTSAFNRIAYPESSQEELQEIIESSGLFPSPSQHSSVDTRIPSENLDQPLEIGGVARIGGQAIGVISAIDTSYRGAGVEQTVNVQLFLQNHRRLMMVPVSMIDEQPNDAHLQIGAYITLAEEAAEATIVAVRDQYAEVAIRDVQPQPSQLFQYWQARTHPEPAGVGGNVSLSGGVGASLGGRATAGDPTAEVQSDLAIYGIDFTGDESKPVVATVDQEVGERLDPPTIYDRMLDDSDD